MGGLSKILGGAAAVGGAALLGSYLFPSTTSSLTGGLLGSTGTTGIGPVASGTDYAAMLGDVSPQASSIFSNPTVLSSGILAGTSLLGGLFGNSADEEARAAAEAEAKRQFDAKLALEQAQLLQNLEIAKINAAARGGGGGNGAAVSAQLKIAKNAAIAANAAQRAQAMQIPLQYDKRAETAQNTGAQSGSFFNNLTQLLQAPALRGA